MFGALAGMGVVVILLVILTSLFWVWMLVDCLTNQRLDSTQKLIWVIVILFGHVLGALIYYIVGRESGSSTPQVPGP